MRRIFRPLPRLPLRAAGPLTVSVITPFPPCYADHADPTSGTVFLLLSPTFKHMTAFRPRGARARPPATGCDAPSGAGAAVVGQPPAAQFRDGLLEVVERLEAPVHGGEPEVGDLVEVTKRPEDGQPDLVGRHLGQAARPDRLLHPLGEHSELVLVDRPALAGPLHAPDDLVSGKRLGHPAALGNHEDDRLLSGKPPPALRAGPPPAYRGAVVGHPAVDNPAVRVTAERTVHAITSRNAVRYPHRRGYPQLLEEPHPCNY